MMKLHEAEHLIAVYPTLEDYLNANEDEAEGTLLLTYLTAVGTIEKYSQLSKLENGGDDSCRNYWLAEGEFNDYKY